MTKNPKETTRVRIKYGMPYAGYNHFVRVDLEAAYEKQVELAKQGYLIKELKLL